LERREDGHELHGESLEGNGGSAAEANLPGGTEVRVEPVDPKTLAERLKDVIGTVHGGPPDWAENHDHYVHGTACARLQNYILRSWTRNWTMTVSLVAAWWIRFRDKSHTLTART